MDRSGRIRILYCIDNMRVGGAELNALRTAERLDRSRFDVSVARLSDGGPLADRYAAAGIPIFPFPIANLFGARAIREGARFARFLSARRIDVVHSHDMYDNVFATLWARVAGAPVVIASRRWWHSLPERRYRFVGRCRHAVTPPGGVPLPLSAAPLVMARTTSF